MARPIDAAETQAFYGAALTALRYLETRQPTGRRFGADADALWSNFKGDLTTADRIDLMIRDADAQWPASFGARVVFADEAVSEDDAFGPTWVPPSPIEAEDLWRASLGKSTPSDVRATLATCAGDWGLSLESFEVGAVRPADRLVVAGPSAIASLIEAFVGQRDLDWADQVIVVATPPAHRQLAALAIALAPPVVNAAKPATLVTASASLQAAPGRRALISPDAAEADAARARAVAGA